MLTLASPRGQEVTCPEATGVITREAFGVRAACCRFFSEYSEVAKTVRAPTKNDKLISIAINEPDTVCFEVALSVMSL